MKKISVVISTYNEEENIARAIKSVLWADEVIVCDMYSADKTVEIAKNLGARVIYHKYLRYVEPARNFSIKEASNLWVLILDADEEIPEGLKEKLLNLPDEIDYLEIPRKNLIFGKWMKASGWWPDYNIRFFKKGKVIWGDKIHSKPQAEGNKEALEAVEQLSITHHNYSSISQYLQRLDRYTDIQAQELGDDHKFKWQDLLLGPFNEFLSRFFARRGFEDGIHGLAVSLLQSFSFLVVYLKLWELQKFKEEEIQLSKVREVITKSGHDLRYWFNYYSLSQNKLMRVIQKVKRKIYE